MSVCFISQSSNRKMVVLIYFKDPLFWFIIPIFNRLCYDDIHFTQVIPPILLSYMHPLSELSMFRTRLQALWKLNCGSFCVGFLNAAITYNGQFFHLDWQSVTQSLSVSDNVIIFLFSEYHLLFNFTSLYIDYVLDVNIIYLTQNWLNWMTNHILYFFL